MSMKGDTHIATDGWGNNPIEILNHERGDMVEKQEVMARLCRLTTKVMDEVFHCDEPADCWCGEGDQNPLQTDYRFSESIIEFIEEAVSKALFERM